MPMNQRRQLVDRGFHRLAEIVQRAFADAVDPFDRSITFANSQFFHGLPAM